MKWEWILGVLVVLGLLYAALIAYPNLWKSPAYRPGEILYCSITTMTEQGQLLSYPCPNPKEGSRTGE